MRGETLPGSGPNDLWIYTTLTLFHHSFSEWSGLDFSPGWVQLLHTAGKEEFRHWTRSCSDYPTRFSWSFIAYFTERINLNVRGSSFSPNCLFSLRFKTSDVSTKYISLNMNCTLEENDVFLISDRRSFWLAIFWSENHLQWPQALWVIVNSLPKKETER